MGFLTTAYGIIQWMEGNERTKIINVIVKKRGKSLTAYIFPRWTRLPINYMRHFNDPDKTIKPGSSEMAGFVITVDRDVYEFSTFENVWEALDYVSSTHEDLKPLYEELSKEIDTSPEEFNTSFKGLEEVIDRLWRKGIENGFIKKECLEGIESKVFKGGLIEVQYNPLRKTIVSKSKVEKRKKGEEVCPYCIKEEGREDIPWNGYILSANPYPYYDHHLVIVNRKHIYQYIDLPALKVMAEFVLNAPHYFCVYNGPPGTSILTHMHFQAGIYNFPVEKAKKEVLNEEEGLRVSRIIDFPTRAVIVEKRVEN